MKGPASRFVSLDLILRISKFLFRFLNFSEVFTADMEAACCCGAQILHPFPELSFLQPGCYGHKQRHFENPPAAVVSVYLNHICRISISLEDFSICLVVSLCLYVEHIISTPEGVFMLCTLG